MIYVFHALCGEFVEQPLVSQEGGVANEEALRHVDESIDGHLRSADALWKVGETSHVAYDALHNNDTLRIKHYTRNVRAVSFL